MLRKLLLRDKNWVFADAPMNLLAAQVSILLRAKDRLCDLAAVSVHQGLQRSLPQVCPPNPVQQREGRTSLHLVLTSVPASDVAPLPDSSVLQEIDEYIAQAKDRSYETMMRFGKRGLNLAANAAVTAASKVGRKLISDLCRRLKSDEMLLQCRLRAREWFIRRQSKD